jgi:hypothetical protein
LAITELLSVGNKGEIKVPILNELVLVNYSPKQGLDRNTIRRRKLIEKIDQQIKIATDPTFTPTRSIWVKDDSGSRRVEVPKRLKRWWSNSGTGTTHLTIRYGSKVLALSKDGKNAIQCNAQEIASVLARVKDAVAAGEMDDQLHKVSQFGSKVQFKKREVVLKKS